MGILEFYQSLEKSCLLLCARRKKILKTSSDIYRIYNMALFSSLKKKKKKQGGWGE